jgi:hypothetical protein
MIPLIDRKTFWSVPLNKLNEFGHSKRWAEWSLLETMVLH